MSESELHRVLALGVIALGGLVFVVLFWIAAPYGRHASDRWGPMLSSRLGWTVMESPSLLLFAAVYLCGPQAFEPVPLLFACLWLTHYGYRTLIYPARLRSARKPIPLVIAGMGFTFNVVNAYLNARWLSALGSYPDAYLLDPRCWVGTAAFGAGFALNIHSDNILLRLRKPGEQGYAIPQGGAFRWLSSPNYSAEIFEWAGWALATWSLAGLSFLCFSLANLAPRAIANHRWYQRTFADYPKRRRALIPWLL